MRSLFLTTATLVLGMQAYSQQNLWDATDGLPSANFATSSGTTTAAFDNNEDKTATDWFAAVGGSPWLQANLSTAKMITGYSIAAVANNGASEFAAINESPRNFTLQGSNTGAAGSFTVVDTRTGVTWDRKGATRLFTVANPAAYQYYRLVITSNNGQTNTSLSELQFFTQVRVSGKVFSRTANSNTYGFGTQSGDAALPGVTVSLVNEAGTAAANTITDATGYYEFDASTITYPNLVGDFVVVVTPPAGYTFISDLQQAYTSYILSRNNYSRILKVADGTYPFLSAETTNFGGTIGIKNYVSNSRWDFGRNFTRNSISFNQQVSSLDFGLKLATGFDFSQFYPAGYTALPTNLITVENSGTFGNYSPSSYPLSQPTRPNFNAAAANTDLYSAFTGASTTFTYKNTPYENRIGFNPPNNGVLPNGTYTVSNFSGSIQGDIAEVPINYTGAANNGDGTNLNSIQGSLFETFNGGWRKSYGATKGDVTDRYLVVNGATSGSGIVMQTNQFALTAGKKYAVFFNFKCANSSTQGITQPAGVRLDVFNSSNTFVAGADISTGAPTTSSEDLPTSQWAYKNFIYDATSTGNFYVTLKNTTLGGNGNDFYIDNIGFYELRRPINISGTIWHDINGSANNTFTGIQTGSEIGTNAGGLYAYLIDNAGLIVDIATVNNNGTYTFVNAPENASNLRVSISAQAQQSTNAFGGSSLSDGWVNTSPLTSVPFNTSTTDITGKDFGIEILPDTYDKTENVNRNLNVGQLYSLSDNPLQGSDTDGPSNIEAGGTFKITTLPYSYMSSATADLYYNNVKLTVGAIINNYDPNKLAIAFTGGASTIGMQVRFEYVTIDLAGQPDPTPATYTVNMGMNLLPLKLKYMVATGAPTANLISWATSASSDISKFEIERSANGTNFTAIGEVAANNQTGTTTYSFSDANTVTTKTYYRLKIIDNNGHITYSGIAIINRSSSNKPKIVYNPTSNTILLVKADGKYNGHCEAFVVDNAGRLIAKAVLANQVINTIQLSNAANGIYTVVVKDMAGNTTEKLAVMR